MEHALFISARRERTCLRASVIREVRIRGRVTPRSAPGIAASGRIAGPTDGDSAAAHKHRPRLKSTLAEIRNRLTKHPPLLSHDRRPGHQLLLWSAMTPSHPVGGLWLCW